MIKVNISGVEYITGSGKVEPWSIHNNTLPLSELSAEQAAELFNYWRNGGSIEIFGGTHWHPWSHIASVSDVFRAKQKTERELFIDAAFKARPSFVSINPVCLTLLNELFDAGFKAPKVGE